MHPRFLLDDETMTILDLWGAWRGGLGGRGPLPFGGGSAEQPALLMDAFYFLEAVAEQLSPGKTT